MAAVARMPNVQRWMKTVAWRLNRKKRPTMRSSGGLDQQQDNLASDARQLERLQSAAQGADGQLAAIGYANQLASNQANQLLQIRSLLIAQQNAEAARLAAELDANARGEARERQMRTWNYQPSAADRY